MPGAATSGSGSSACRNSAIELTVDGVNSDFPINYAGSALVRGKSVSARPRLGTQPTAGLWSVVDPLKLSLQCRGLPGRPAEADYRWQGAAGLQFQSGLSGSGRFDAGTWAQRQGNCQWHLRCRHIFSRFDQAALKRGDVTWYNTRRPHSSLGRLTPDEIIWRPWR